MRGFDATLGGYAWLPRMIDKARAQEAGTLGDLEHPCPIDATLLRLLGLDVATFDAVVAREPTDAGVLDALAALGVPAPEEARFDPQALEDELRAEG